MALIPVTELKQWAYCERIVYYHAFVPGGGVATFKMAEAGRAQEMIESLEMRRTLREYGLEGAQRRFGVWLADEVLGISGKIDLLLVGAERSAVVDFKLTSGEPGRNHRMQLGGYALLVRAALGIEVTTGFIYRIADGRVFEIGIGEELLESVRTAVSGIRECLAREVLPAATEVRGRCVECEYQNFCGDVW